MKNDFFNENESFKILPETQFPKMLWLDDQSIYEKAIFIKNYNQFIFMIEELSFALHKNNNYEYK